MSPGKTWIRNSSPDLTVLSWQSIWVGTSAQCFFVLVTMLQPFVGNETVSFICFSLWKMGFQGIFKKNVLCLSKKVLTTAHFGTLYSKHFLALPCSHLRTGTVYSSGLYSICYKLKSIILRALARRLFRKCPCPCLCVFAIHFVRLENKNLSPCIVGLCL